MTKKLQFERTYDMINFDENAMAGLRWQGLPEDRLWDYAPVGCLENTLAGDDRSGLREWH
jgi:formate C-acetyltransferase